MHNAGNDAFVTLAALQLLIEPNTKINELRSRSGTLNVRRSVVSLPTGMSASSRNLSASPAAAKFNPPNTAGTQLSIFRPNSTAKDLYEWGVRQSGYAVAATQNGAGVGTGAGTRSGLPRNGQIGVGRHWPAPATGEGCAERDGATPIVNALRKEEDKCIVFSFWPLLLTGVYEYLTGLFGYAILCVF